MAAPASNRQVTKEETREALIAAATREFAENGLDAPSLDAICARAGFTRGAFYVHFRDKDDLIVAVVERVLSGFQDAVLAPSDARVDLSQTVARFVGAVAARDPAAVGTTSWRFHHTLAACARSAKLRRLYLGLQEAAVRRVTEAAVAGQRAGTVRADVAAPALAEILVLLTLGLSAAIDLEMPFDLDGGASVLARLLGSGDELDVRKRRRTRSRRRS